MSRSEHDLPGSDETQPDSTGSRLSPDDVTVVEPRVPVGDIAFDADSETFDADSETFDADSETFDAESETFDAESETFDAESETFDADSETFDADSSPSTSAIARGQATDPDFGPPEVSTPAQGGGEPGKMPEPGDRIGEEFEIIRLLGAGGMGSVFLGRDLRLGRKVAIKVMKLEGKDRATRERFAALFDSEARATARLNHPNVVTIHQVGRAFGMPYLVLELLQGASLSERMQAEPLPIVEGVRILCEVCRALEHAHGQGLVHRDLKPQNIFLTDDGQLKVVDFGLATFDPARVRAPDGRRQRETLSEAFAVGGSSDEGAVAVSPAYMAPEQWRAQEQDARTDIWACGVILYQMLTGHVPFTRPLDVLGDKPVPRPSARAPDAPAALEAIVLRCMARERSERFQDARALLEALQAWQSGARSDPGGAPYRFLEAFGEADAGWFFGRDRETAQLAHMLQRRPLIAIVGPSGAGKSSLARAGVLGRLRARGEAWQTLVMVPGRRPLTTLRARLAALAPERFAALGGDDVDLRQRPGFVGEVLRDHARAAGVRLAVLIDQFEEIVTLTDDDAEREAFAQAILSAADDPEGPIRVMVTMRDDFLAPLGALPALRDAVVGSLYALGPPDEASMARAVQGPAQAAGFELEAGLGEAMVADLRGEAAPLPLLQFAASQLWEARDRERRRLTHAALEALGGVAGVLATHAESLVSGLDKADLEAAKMLLCALVTPSGTRRAVPRAELLDGQADARRGADVLDRLIGGRLLTVSRDAGEPVVQLAHESLIARWDRLQQWLGDDQDRRHVAERLREAATHWRDAGEPREMLWGGAPLSQVDAFFADDATLGALEQRFVRASRRADRRSRNLRRAAIAMVLLTATGIAIGSSVAMLALRDREQAAQAAAEQARRAEAHAKEAAARAETERRQGFARVLGAWSESKQESDAMAALLLAREAVRLAPMPATLGALGAAIYASLERRVLPGDAPVRFVRWDGSGLVTVDGRGLVRRWTDDGHPIAATRVSGTPSAVATASTAGATGRDDRLLVGTADGRVVEITREGEQAERLPAGAKVHDFAANDRTVAVARADGAVWLLEHGAAPGTARAVATHQGAALVVRWSPAR
ncbi:MAG: hypothetical protein RIT45_3579, partial [Pseudomonadota bacterium]